jgi:hypothetical protein
MLVHFYRKRSMLGKPPNMLLFINYFFSWINPSSKPGFGLSGDGWQIQTVCYLNRQQFID